MRLPLVPEAFANFYLALAGAGAALIGLLFVAVSINPERIVRQRARPMLQAIAGSAFIALINMFFVSVYALLPSINIGLPAVILGVAGIGSALLIGGEIFRRLRQRGQSGRRSSQSPWWLEVSRELALLGVSVALYGFEIAQGIGALNTPSDANHIFALGNILVCIGALGLLRAWQLLGAWGGPWLNDEK